MSVTEEEEDGRCRRRRRREVSNVACCNFSDASGLLLFFSLPDNDRLFFFCRVFL
jgi:hypothetical protein